MPRIALLKIKLFQISSLQNEILKLLNVVNIGYLYEEIYAPIPTVKTNLCSAS